MTSGMTASPSEASRRVASSTEVSGSVSMTALIAPMPIAAPATAGSPGRCENAMPIAAPMYIAGKIGPPRKALSDTP